MVVGVKKDKVQSVILTQERDFKARAVTLFKGAAFPAEKRAFDNMGACLDMISQYELVHNFVIDARPYKLKELIKDLEFLSETAHDEDMKVLIYLDDDLLEEKEKFENIYDKTFVASFPLKQADFNRAFHAKKAKVNPKSILAANVEFNDQSEEQSHAPKNSGNSGALSLVETSQHIKDTIIMINTIAKDRTDLKVLADVGQRFNGLIGAFKFFGKKEGYPHLGNLAEMIDTISRSYQSDEASEIEASHYQLLVDAARCSYLILKDMREGGGIKEERIKSHGALAMRFKKQGNLRFKENKSQAEVDEILEKYRATS